MCNQNTYVLVDMQKRLPQLIFLSGSEKGRFKHRAEQWTIDDERVQLVCCCLLYPKTSPDPEIVPIPGSQLALWLFLDFCEILGFIMCMHDIMISQMYNTFVLKYTHIRININFKFNYILLMIQGYGCLMINCSIKHGKYLSPYIFSNYTVES